MLRAYCRVVMENYRTGGKAVREILCTAHHRSRLIFYASQTLSSKDGQSLLLIQRENFYKLKRQQSETQVLQPLCNGLLFRQCRRAASRSQAAWGSCAKIQSSCTETWQIQARTKPAVWKIRFACFTTEYHGTNQPNELPRVTKYSVT